jgi:predicted dehydrogenase
MIATGRVAPHCARSWVSIAVIGSCPAGRAGRGLQLAPHKPMITTVEKGQGLLPARDQSGSPLVIGFQGALSPLVADTRKRAATAEFGELVSVAGMNPRERVLPLPRALEAATGLVAGGLYVRCRAHMMNTVCFLPDAYYERVSARINSRERTLMSSVRPPVTKDYKPVLVNRGS